MYDLTAFSLRDMTACGAALRKPAPAADLEGTAAAVVRYLFDNLRDGTGAPACALVRFFITRPFAALDAERQAAARRLLGGQAEAPGIKCLTLVGTAGVEPRWNRPAESAGHRVIPLPSAEGVRRLPMIAQLVAQFGLEIPALLGPDAGLLVDLEQRSYNVFHVPEAAGNPYVPDQETFVRRYGVRSVVGFGGMLPSGNLFAVILFTRVPVSRETADLFRPLALSVKLAVLPFER